MSEKVSIYYLELHHPQEGKGMIRLEGETTIGCANNNTIVLKESDLAPRHCILRVHQEILTLFQVAESGTTKIGRQSLDNGRMYILEKGDKIFLQDVKCIIRLEKEKAPENDQDEDNVESDQTNESIDLPDFNQEEDEDEEQETSFLAKLKSKFKRKNLQEELEEEEEVLAEDEEESEVEPEDAKEDNIKNSIYIPKATIDEDEEDDNKKKQTKKPKIKYVINREDMPAFFARLYAFVAEIIIAFAFASNVAPILDIGPYYDQFFIDLSPLVQKLIDMSSPFLGEHTALLQPLNSFSFISLFMTWFLLNMLSNMILGANLGQALIFVKTEGSFVTSRLKAVLRFLLSLILYPFIIFDAPALIKKRTLKEVLTASELSFRHSILKIFGVLIVLPAFTAAIVILPALLDPTLMEGPRVTRNLVIKELKENTPMQTHPWRSLKLAISYDQAISNEWALSPYLLGRNENTLSAIHFIRFHNDNVDTVTAGPIAKTQLPQKLIQAIAKLDPFYKSKYPDLDKAIETNSFNESADKDAMALFVDTLSLNWDTLPRFLTERGPILSPYLELKKDLLSKLNLQITNEANAKIIGHKNVLEIFVSNNHSTLTSVQNGVFSTLSISSRDGGRAAIAKFAKTFLSHAAPLMDNATTSLENSPTWTVFDFLDYFTSQEKLILQGQSIQALSNLTSKSLAQRESQPWSKSIIEEDYKKTMNILRKLQENTNQEWANQAFNAMNIDQALWQEQTPVEAPVEEPVQEAPNTNQEE